MSSKIMIRTCVSSTIRTLINRHLRPTVAATTNIQKETPASIYNWHYLLPNGFVPRSVNIGGDAAGSLVMEESAHGRWKFEADEKKKVEEYSMYDDDNDYSESDYDPFNDVAFSDVDDDEVEAFDDDDDDEDADK